jgi:hypothetical protein
LHESFHTHCRAADFDLEPNEEAGAVEVTTDDWTLTFEGFPDAPVAYLAVDSEPVEPAEYARAIHDAFRATELRALAAANAAAGGAIVAALQASGDPFSQALGAVIAGG